MLKLSYDEEEYIEDIIKSMDHKLGQNGDRWYPEIAEIDAYIAEYNKPDVKFLISLLYPAFELNTHQKEVQNYVRNLLADEKVIKYLGEDEEDLSDILEKYNKKLKNKLD